MNLAHDRISTVTTPSASYALVNLATVKDELGISSFDTSFDGSLTRNIGFVTQIISNYCSTPFAPFAVEALSDLFQFGKDSFPGNRFAGEDRIALARCPALAITSVVQARPDGTTLTLVSGTDYLPDLAKGELLRLDSYGRITRWESYPLTVAYIAGFGSLIIGEAQTIPATAPYTVIAVNAATFAFDQGVAYANGTPLVAVSANPAAGQYAVAPTGIYTFAAADEGKSITLAYANNQIPADLVSHSLEIITARWASRGRDPALVQRETPGIGTEKFWFGSEPGQDGELPPRIQAALDNTYRSPRIA